MRLRFFFEGVTGVGLRLYLVRTSAKLSGHVYLTVGKKQAVLIRRIHVIPFPAIIPLIPQLKH